MGSWLEIYGSISPYPLYNFSVCYWPKVADWMGNINVRYQESGRINELDERPGPTQVGRALNTDISFEVFFYSISPVILLYHQNLT